jgi:hypothetical protein
MRGQGAPYLLRYANAYYRVAGVRDLARLVASMLFQWIADAGISKQRILSWLGKLFNIEELKDYRRNRVHDSSSIIPPELKDQVAQVFSQLSEQGVKWGDFVMALTDALDNPPKHLEWVVRDGEEYLVPKQARPRQEHPVRGKRFIGRVLIGIWWATPNARAGANRRLRSFIQNNNGAVFYSKMNKSTGLREYGGFIVIPHISAEGIGISLHSLAKAMASDTGHYRLSAVKLDGLAEPRMLAPSDQHHMRSIRGIKFNDTYTLPEVVNGQVPEYRSILQLLRKAV